MAHRHAFFYFSSIQKNHCTHYYITTDSQPFTMNTPHSNLFKNLTDESILAIPNKHYSEEQKFAWLNRIRQVDWLEEQAIQEMFIRREAVKLITFATLKAHCIDFLFVSPYAWGKGYAFQLFAEIENQSDWISISLDSANYQQTTSFDSMYSLSNCGSVIWVTSSIQPSMLTA